MKINVLFVIIISVFLTFLLGLSSAGSGENHSVRVKTSRRHSSILSINNVAGKGMVIGIDARHLLRLMEMDPNLYVLYIGSDAEFERLFGGSKKAVHISLKGVKENTLQLPGYRTLVLICPSGQQSPVAAGILSAQGYVVYYVIGGMAAVNKLKNRKPMPVKTKPDQDNEKKTIPKKKDEHGHPKFIIEEDMGC